MIRYFYFLLLLLSFSLNAQYTEYTVKSTVQGLVSSEEINSFWMHSNQRGRIDELTDIAGWLTATGTYFFRDGTLIELGLGGLYQNGYTNEIQLDEYYLSYQNDWLKAYAGRKQKEELYRGLSATNENIVWSLNSRPIPGISIETNTPLMFWKDAGLGFMASWEEFFSDENDRYIQNVRIHHKSFHLVFNRIRNLTIIAGGHHYVQWAGKSPEHGELPSGFDDYLRVITGGSIGGVPEGFVGESEINGLGNHLGGYEVILKTSFLHYDIDIIYNTIFEDMSGLKLRNTPDGRYGIYIEDQEPDKWVQAFMYEYYYTRHQSKTYPTTDGKDNYFNNHLYQSGWTYESRIIGLPFFVLNEDRSRVAHNNIVAHHVGISGIAFYTYPYKLLTSYRGNYGAKGGSSKPIEQIFSTFLDVRILQDFVDLNLQFGVDFNFAESSNVGFGLKLSKEFL